MDQRTKEKCVLIGYLLDSMKEIYYEDAKLRLAGVDIATFGIIESKLWEGIKFIVGMPAKEEEGVFISDYWYDVAYDYVCQKITKEQAIVSLLSWETEFEK
ncbi:hypothetical protein [Cytobacillus luteolus]|uniref:hypothetical protein n=1 Tax=Litchfieldia luteola TaxID=682179 RepID=UPI001AE26725|nr:hypothetical protein [Cytobacillus luteolus]MBP1944640.1 hypothetical protein [Cytobacillus luteolus]